MNEEMRLILIILASAVVTYFTRIGGHLVLSRFDKVHPRVQAGLDAVPSAVLTTLVAPSLLTAGIAELAAFAVATVVSIRVGLLTAVTTALLTLIVLRHLIG
ncbi:AzlD family protein [Limoniibacter endophyticus]|uniref:Branched-chain amino acid transport n=1 Tax=Limoniibacter endophyticus TaxID=1565040 RepID=A0A8J3GHJ1_9HYPH|nr:AzlD domain-containing protein [Limoniibacter endophyticus]GHC75263.1 branched-chain amino acid transport [Limoniibacter endophyticus]